MNKMLLLVLVVGVCSSKLEASETEIHRKKLINNSPIEKQTSELYSRDTSTYYYQPNLWFVYRERPRNSVVGKYLIKFLNKQYRDMERDYFDQMIDGSLHPYTGLKKYFSDRDTFSSRFDTLEKISRWTRRLPWYSKVSEESTVSSTRVLLRWGSLTLNSDLKLDFQTKETLRKLESISFYTGKRLSKYSKSFTPSSLNKYSFKIRMRFNVKLDSSDIVRTISSKVIGKIRINKLNMNIFISGKYRPKDVDQSQVTFGILL